MTEQFPTLPPAPAMPFAAPVPAPPPRALPYILQESQITETPDGMLSQYCVYMHRYGPDDTLIFIGVDRLIHVFSCPEARNNSEWCAITQSKETLQINIVATGTHGVCLSLRSQLLLQHQAICNIRGRHVGGATVIECVETEQRYATQTEAARATGVSQSAISAHLRGDERFKTVKGLTFRRIARDAPRSTGR